MKDIPADCEKAPPVSPTTRTAAGIPVGPRSVATVPAVGGRTVTAAIESMPDGVSLETHTLRRRPGFPAVWAKRAPQRVSRHDRKLIVRDQTGGLTRIGQQALRNAELEFERQQAAWEKMRDRDASPRQQKRAWARLERARITLETVRENFRELARRIAAGQAREAEAEAEAEAQAASEDEAKATP